MIFIKRSFLSVVTFGERKSIGWQQTTKRVFFLSFQVSVNFVIKEKNIISTNYYVANCVQKKLIVFRNEAIQFRLTNIFFFLKTSSNTFDNECLSYTLPVHIETKYISVTKLFAIVDDVTSISIKPQSYQTCLLQLRCRVYGFTTKIWTEKKEINLSLRESIFFFGGFHWCVQLFIIQIAALLIINKLIKLNMWHLLDSKIILYLK